MFQPCNRAFTPTMHTTQSGVEQMMVQPVVSSAAAAAALGARLPPGLLDKLVARVDFAMRHLTAADVGDLATALAPYTR